MITFAFLGVSKFLCISLVVSPQIIMEGGKKIYNTVLKVICTFFKKERRMMVQYEKKEGEREVSEKVAARAFAMEYLTDLIPSAIRHLQDIGFFYDTIERGMHLLN